MKKVIKYSLYCSLFLFLFSIFCLIPVGVSANEINESYDYEFIFSVDNNSYFMQLNQDIINDTEMLDYLSTLPSRTLTGIRVSINDVFYNQLIVNTNITTRTLEIFFYNVQNGDYLVLLSSYNASIYNYYSERINLYFDRTYNFTMFEILNICFDFTNDIEKGYYTFNQSIDGLNFTNYSFNGPITDFDINGTLVYLNEDGYYLFNALSLNPTQDYFDLSMFNVNNQSSSYEIFGQFTNETDFLRYWYLDNQTIDTILYEYLSNNGVFAFSYGGLDNNATFWDVINSYVNIPNTIIGGMLGFSIFSGTTLLVIFATITIIVLAIKVIKMVNWS